MYSVVEPDAYEVCSWNFVAANLLRYAHTRNESGVFLYSSRMQYKYVYVIIHM